MLFNIDVNTAFVIFVEEEKNSNILHYRDLYDSFSKYLYLFIKLK